MKLKLTNLVTVCLAVPTLVCVFVLYIGIRKNTMNFHEQIASLTEENVQLRATNEQQLHTITALEEANDHLEDEVMTVGFLWLETDKPVAELTEEEHLSLIKRGLREHQVRAAILEDCSPFAGYFYPDWLCYEYQDQHFQDFKAKYEDLVDHVFLDHGGVFYYTGKETVHYDYDNLDAETFACPTFTNLGNWLPLEFVDESFTNRDGDFILRQYYRVWRVQGT